MIPPLITENGGQEIETDPWVVIRVLALVRHLEDPGSDDFQEVGYEVGTSQWEHLQTLGLCQGSTQNESQHVLPRLTVKSGLNVKFNVGLLLSLFKPGATHLTFRWLRRSRKHGDPYQRSQLQEILQPQWKRLTLSEGRAP